MQALVEVILPVFLLLGFGYVAVWRGLFSDAGVDGLMTFTQSFAIPCLLFRAIATLDLGRQFDASLLASFYSGAVAGFLAGLLGARILFGRPWEDSVAIGFCALFSNSLLLGVPITERAYGAETLGPNYAIVAVHSPICYGIGLAAMELVQARGRGAAGTARSILRAITHNAMVIGIGLGFLANVAGLALPAVIDEALGLMIRAALPAALFGLGGVLYRYRPEGDARIVGYVCAVSLVLHPGVVWAVGSALELERGAFRSAVVTAAMAPGVNTYIFANLYGVARRVAASAVLVGTLGSVLTTWVWLALLP